MESLVELFGKTPKENTGQFTISHLYAARQFNVMGQEVHGGPDQKFKTNNTGLNTGSAVYVFPNIIAVVSVSKSDYRGEITQFDFAPVKENAEWIHVLVFERKYFESEVNHFLLAARKDIAKLGTAVDEQLKNGSRVELRIDNSGSGTNTVQGLVAVQGLDSNPIHSSQFDGITTRMIAQITKERFPPKDGRVLSETRREELIEAHNHSFTPFYKWTTVDGCSVAVSNTGVWITKDRPMSGDPRKKKSLKE
jgi:hypothetical protein